MLLSEVAKQVSLLSVLKSYRRGVSETFRADPKKCKTSQQLLLQISPCVHLATPIYARTPKSRVQRYFIPNMIALRQNIKNTTMHSQR